MIDVLVGDVNTSRSDNGERNDGNYERAKRWGNKERHRNDEEIKTSRGLG